MLLTNCDIANEHQWLIVFDNVDVTDPNDDRSREKMERFQKLMPSGSGHVIVTTRYFFQHAMIRGFHVRKLDPEDSLMVFNTYRHMYDSNVDASEEEADSRALLERFDGLPLAMKVAARYIKDLGGVKNFLNEYVAMEDEFLEEADGMSAHQKLNTIWELPFARLSNESYANARKLFGLLCLMGSEDIPVQEFFSPSQSLGLEFKFLESESRWERIKPLRALKDLGLIEIENLSTDNASVHRVLSAAFRNSSHGLHSRDALQLSADAAAIILNRLFPKDEGSQGLWAKWEQCSKYMKHIEALVRIFEESEQKSTESKPRKLRSSKAMDDLMRRCCWYQVERGQADQSLKILKFATKISLDTESKEYATLCQGYACVYFELNDLKNCEKWNKDCLRIREVHLDRDDPEIANCRSNLANLYTAIGRFEDARNEVTQALKPLNADRQEDLFYLGMRYMMIGRTYLRERKLEDAKGWFDKARRTLEAIKADFLLLL
jgi:tetratricopeptide (TPR) repeat protein